jgi:hypothetical protein
MTTRNHKKNRARISSILVAASAIPPILSSIASAAITTDTWANGASSTTWDTVGTQEFTGSPGKFTNSDAVVFLDNAGTQAVNVGASGVQPSSVEFKHISSSTLTTYTFTDLAGGTTGISGTSTITLDSSFNGSVIFASPNTYTGTTTISGGALYVDAAQTGAGNFFFSSLSNNATLGGTGSIGLASGKSISLTGSGSSAMAILSPGDPTTPDATLTLGTTGNNNSVTLGSRSELALDIGGTAAASDEVIINGSLNTSSSSSKLFINANNPTLGKYTLVSYSAGDSYTGNGNQASSGGFSTVSGLPSNYRLNVTTSSGSSSAGEIDMLRLANITSQTASPVSSTVITGGTTNINVSATNAGSTGGDTLSISASASGKGFSGSASNSSVASGANFSPAAFNGFSATGTAAAAGTYTGTVSFTGTDVSNSSSTAINSGVTSTISVTVLNHSNAALALSSGNNQTVFQNTPVTATLSLTNSGSSRSPLDVNTLSSGLAGSTGTAVIASNGSGAYTATLNTSTAGLAQSRVFTLKAGDEQSLPGASALTTLSQTVGLNVYSHANPTLSLTSGNNQTLIVGSTGATAQMTLSNPVTVPTAMDVTQLDSTLTGKFGSAAVSAGGTSTYTAALNSSTVGLNQTETYHLKAGDSAAITGANPQSAVSQSVTVNVVNPAQFSFTSTNGTSSIVPDAKITTDTINLGSFVAGSGAAGVQTINLSNLIANLAGTNANLELTQSATGTPNAISYTAVPFGGLTAGSVASNGGVVTLNTATPGTFSNTYTINLQDDQTIYGHNAVGSDQLVLDLTGTITSAYRATATFSDNPPATGTHLSGISTALGSYDINPIGLPPSVQPGYLDLISNGNGATGYVTIAPTGGPSAMILIGISLTAADSAGPDHVLTAANDLATLQDIVADLNLPGASTNSAGSVQAYVYDSADAAAFLDAENALDYQNGGNSFSILLVTQDPQYASFDFSNEVGNLDGITSLSMTNIGVIPEPVTTPLIAFSAGSLLMRRRRHSSAVRA